MRPVMLPRFIRPRLLLLPLVLGVLVAPAFLTTSTMPDGSLHADAVCKNERPARNVVVPHDAPTCVNCRAPLLNAPLAQAKPQAPATIVALPPAA